MEEDDPIGNALKSRRIPHGKSGKGRGKGKGGSTFNVLKTINEYDVVLGKVTHADGHGISNASGKFIIHGLTPNEDGLIATLDLKPSISGVAVLAGSRKALKRIVEDFEAEEEEDEEDEEDEEEDQNEDEVDNPDGDDNDTTNPQTDDEGDESLPPESAEERTNRLTKTFEKNSFRNPKFWMRWKGHVHTPNSETVETQLETNMAYIVFSGNDCGSWEGTLSCKALGWKNKQLRGHRRKPQVQRGFTMEEARGFWRGVGGA